VTLELGVNHQNRVRSLVPASAPIPRSLLAVLPDTMHMQMTRRADLLLPMLSRFLELRSTPLGSHSLSISFSRGQAW